MHYQITVKGKVQGVFFRVSTKKEAIRLGLVGFVRNEADGSVYLEVEGEQKNIDELVTWLKAGGPPHARVDQVEISSGDFQEMAMFEIR